MTVEDGVTLGLIAGGAVLAYLAWRKVDELGPREGGAAIGRAAADLPAGVVVGIGDSVGLPRTDRSACDVALAEGRLWDASFVCPAGTWLAAAGTAAWGRDSAATSANGQAAELAQAAEGVGYGEDPNVNARDAMLMRRARPAPASSAPAAYDPMLGSWQYAFPL